MGRRSGNELSLWRFNKHFPLVDETVKTKQTKSVQVIGYLLQEDRGFVGMEITSPCHVKRDWTEIEEREKKIAGLGIRSHEQKYRGVSAMSKIILGRVWTLLMQDPQATKL